MANLGRPKGRGMLYGEKKEICTISLTPTGRDGIDAIADSLHISRSELVEQIGRGLIKIVPGDTHFN
jgi:hypothetical protein